MSDFSGSLATFELASLARFLSAMRKTGELHIVDGPLIGCLSFDTGRLVAASVEDERGRGALEFIVGWMRYGEFEFIEGAPSPASDTDLRPEPLDLVEQLVRDAPSHYPEPTTVPRVRRNVEFGAAELTLEGNSVKLLLEIDGRRDVADLSRQLGYVRTLRGLTRLHQLDVVEFDAAVPAEAPAPVARKKSARVVWELVQALAFTAFLVLAVRSVVLNFRVEGISMLPNFETGQVLLVNRAAYFHLDWQSHVRYLFGGPQRGDVVVFHSPVEAGTDYVKRIMGLPGDRVAVSSGTVYVNGAAQTEPYIKVPANYSFPETHVPSDSFFVLGDNRPESLDSHLGWFVPVDNLIGRAWLRYWPPDAIGMVGYGIRR